jgi:hypothetical protein
LTKNTKTRRKEKKKEARVLPLGIYVMKLECRLIFPKPGLGIQDWNGTRLL